MTAADQEMCTMEILPTSSNIHKLSTHFFKVQEMALSTLFVGHETTGTAMAHLLRRLHDSPEVMHRLREEHRQLEEERGPQITSENHDKV